MRLTDDRYTREREYCELGLRLLRHEARTQLIRLCTGISEDRVRKLYKTYLQDRSPAQLRRKRGKAPHELTAFLRNSAAHLQSSLLAGILQSLTLTDPCNAKPQWQPTAAYVTRFCDAYEYYLDCVTTAHFTFEHAWFLMQSLAASNSQLTICHHCSASQLRDVLALSRACPFCECKSSPGAVVPLVKGRQGVAEVRSILR